VQHKDFLHNLAARIDGARHGRRKGQESFQKRFASSNPKGVNNAIPFEGAFGCLSGQSLRLPAWNCRDMKLPSIQIAFWLQPLALGLQFIV
jgi:hypothetical protein